jgi:hypothetical protein
MPAMLWASRIVSKQVFGGKSQERLPPGLAFPVNKIPISAAIEGRGAQAMVRLVLRRRIGRIRAAHAHPGRNRRWTC